MLLGGAESQVDQVFRHGLWRCLWRRRLVVLLLRWGLVPRMLRLDRLMRKLGGTISRVVSSVRHLLLWRISNLLWLHWLS